MRFFRHVTEARARPFSGAGCHGGLVGLRTVAPTMMPSVFPRRMLVTDQHKFGVTLRWREVDSNFRFRTR
jgi:hypothetical protein